MSDISTEGPPDKPYRENPPTHFVEVHWTGGNVSWPTRPFSYLECAPAEPPLTESYYGTASFWLRVNGALTINHDAPFIEIVPVLSMMGPSRPDNLYNSFEITILNNTGTERLHPIANNDRVLDDIRVVCQAVNGEEAVTIPSEIPSNTFNGKWGHILLTWDFLTRAGTITINRIGRANYPTSFSYHLATSGDVSTPAAITAPVAWADSPRYFGAQQVIPEGDPEPPAMAAPAEPLASNYLVSLAHVWISTKRAVDDVSKFVNAEDKPATFGPGGEIILVPAGPDGIPPAVTIKPDFYFVGGPSRFIENAATAGGKATLVGLPPIAQTIAPQIGA